MKLSALLEQVPLRVLVSGDAEIGAIETDSRKVGAGSLFYAREGWHIDSHAFIRDAVRRGARAVVVTRSTEIPLDELQRAGIPTLLAASEDGDLGLLAAAFYGHPTRALRVVGVTGTNGKSSCTYLLEHALAATGEQVAVIGTVNNRFGRDVFPTQNTTPDGLTIQRFARACIDKGATALVLEVSSHGVELGRVAGVAFDVAVFTNLTPEHLDFHRTMERYGSAKAKLFSECLGASADAEKSPVAVVWADDPASERMVRAAAPHARIVRVGTEEGDLTASTLSTCASTLQTQVRFASGGDELAVDLPLIGAFNVANAAVSLAAAQAITGASWQELAESLRTFRGVPGRLERASCRFTPAVLVDYAHTPDAVERVGAALREAGVERLTVVLGAGGDRDASKRAPMAAAALAHADRVVLTSDNPRSEPPRTILDQMLRGVPPERREHVDVIVDRSEAISRAIETAPGVVLIAGKGHESTLVIGERVFAFDDREEARRALWARQHGVAFATVPLLTGWSVERIARAVNGEVACAGDGGPWGALTTDSRSVERGGIFVAIRGARFDGNDYVGAAARDGAALVIAERGELEANSGCGLILVEDGVRALGDLAAALLKEARNRQGGLRVVGVTGSSGKTTVRAMLQALLGDGVLATRGNFNNHIGLPLSVAPLAPCHGFAVLEMGANQPNDIRELTQIVRPDIGVVTSIGWAHTEGFGDIDGVRRAKAGIAEAGLSALVLPSDEALERAWLDAATRAETVVTFGDSGALGGAGVSVARDGARGRVRVQGRNKEVAFELPLSGAHHARNLAAAVAAVELLGVEIDGDAVARIAQLDVPGGRQRELSIGGRLVIDDSYNANPSSMRAALDVLSSSPPPRVAVLGTMAELGERSDALHREVGAYAATLGISVVAFGEAALPIAEGAGPLGGSATSPVELPSLLETLAPVGATILFKGSRSAALERLVESLKVAWGEAG